MLCTVNYEITFPKYIPKRDCRRKKEHPCAWIKAANIQTLPDRLLRGPPAAEPCPVPTSRATQQEQISFFLRADILAESKKMGCTGTRGWASGSRRVSPCRERSPQRAGRGSPKQRAKHGGAPFINPRVQQSPGLPPEDQIPLIRFSFPVNEGTTSDGARAFFTFTSLLSVFVKCLKFLVWAGSISRAKESFQNIAESAGNKSSEAVMVWALFLLFM